MLLTLSLLLLLQSAPTDDAGPVARAGALQFDREDYGRWLLERHGISHLRDYVASELVLHACEERGLLPTQADIDEAYETERQAIIDNFHKGDPERYDESKRRLGYEPETWARVRKLAIRTELAERALAAERRIVSEEALRRLFDDRFGTGGADEGEQVSLDVMFFDMYANYTPDGESPDMAALREEARQRGLRAHEALAAGAPLAEVLPLGDPVPSPFVVDGRLAQYRRLILGPEVERATTRLDDPGDTSGLLQVYNGFYLVRLAERRAVRFDEIADELRQELRDTPPDSADIQEARSWVLVEYEAELLLR